MDIRIERNFLASRHWDQWLIDHEDLRRAAARGVRLGFEAPWPSADHSADDRMMERLIERLPVDADLLEIGPGSGTYTERPLATARRMTLVDISERLLFEALERRFATELDRIALIHDESALLASVPDESIDGAYSIDCFVHIKIDVIHQYLSALGRVLRPGGVALLHCKNWDASEIESWSQTTRAERVYRTTHFAHPDMVEASAKSFGFEMERIELYSSNWLAELRKS